MKRKITRLTLDELAKEMPVLSESMQATLVGGSGTFTEKQYNSMLISGTWQGGYVEDWGYISSMGDVTISGSYPKNKIVTTKNLQKLLVDDGSGIWISILTGLLPPGVGTLLSTGISISNYNREQIISHILDKMGESNIDSAFTVSRTRQIYNPQTGQYDNTIEIDYINMKTGEKLGTITYP